jgi:hypothetical protein
MNIDISFDGVGEGGVMLRKLRSEHTAALLLCPRLKRKKT